MADRDDVFQRLSLEAVQACGHDVAAIERYVSARLAGMNVEDRANVDAAIRRVLAFQAPHRRDGRPN